MGKCFYHRLLILTVLSNLFWLFYHFLALFNLLNNLLQFSHLKSLITSIIRTLETESCNKPQYSFTKTHKKDYFSKEFKFQTKNLQKMYIYKIQHRTLIYLYYNLQLWIFSTHLKYNLTNIYSEQMCVKLKKSQFCIGILFVINVHISKEFFPLE